MYSSTLHHLNIYARFPLKPYLLCRMTWKISVLLLFCHLTLDGFDYIIAYCAIGFATAAAAAARWRRRRKKKNLEFQRQKDKNRMHCNACRWCLKYRWNSISRLSLELDAHLIFIKNNTKWKWIIVNVSTENWKIVVNLRECTSSIESKNLDKTRAHDARLFIACKAWTFPALMREWLRVATQFIFIKLKRTTYVHMSQKHIVRPEPSYFPCITFSYFIWPTFHISSRMRCVK